MRLARALADLFAVCAVGALGLYAVWGAVQSALHEDTPLFALWLVVTVCCQIILRQHKAPAT